MANIPVALPPVPTDPKVTRPPIPALHPDAYDLLRSSRYLRNVELSMGTPCSLSDLVH
jgi:hypothetical protein